HFFRVTDEELTFGNDWVIPSLDFDGLEATKLFELFRIWGNQDDFARLGSDDQKRLIGKEQYLAGAIAASFPAPLASFEIKTAEDVVVEAVNAAVVDDVVVKRQF